MHIFRCFDVMKKIISFGDSVMKGIVTGKNKEEQGRCRYEISKSGFATLCAAKLGIELDNYGKFGNTVVKGVKDVSRHLKQIEDSNAALLEFGGNDCNFDWNSIAENPEIEHVPQTTPKQFSEAYKSLIDKVRETGCTPIILSLPPIDSSKFFSYVCSGFTREKRDNVLKWLGGCIYNIGNWHEMYNLELYKIAADQGVRIIDITTCFLSRKNCPDLFCDDGMHPNEEGHRLISDAICSASLL